MTRKLRACLRLERLAAIRPRGAFLGRVMTHVAHRLSMSITEETQKCITQTTRFYLKIRTR